VKILIVSLLRVGDLLLSAPALRDLRVRYPDSEIHLLVNTQSLRAVPLLPMIDKIHSFDREDIQRSLGESDRPFFEGFDRISQMIDHLNGEKFDLVINLTHTRLSGYILSLIEAKTKNGLCIDAQMKPTFGSKWFRFLNDQVDLDSKDVFHFNDIFRFGMGVGETTPRSACLVVSEAGRAEAKKVLESAQVTGTVIAVQPFTSDEKKDWPLPQLAKALKGFSVRHPEAVFAILAAPFESDRLQSFIDGLKSDGVSAFIAVTTLEGAAGILEKSKLLLTGDTSIKHLAAGLGTKIVEVALGGSDPYRTGAYRHGSIIVRSKETCAPCVHSKPCHRERRFCAERMPSDAIAMIASEVYSGRVFQVGAIASEFASEIEVLKVDCQSLGRFELSQINPMFTEISVARSIDRLCRKMWFSDIKKPIDGLGSQTRRQWSHLKADFPAVSEFEWRHLFGIFESQVTTAEGRIHSLKISIKTLNGSFENQKSYSETVRSIIAFREKIRHSPLLGLLVPLLDGVVEDDISPAFTRLRRLNDVISEIETRTALYRTVIRSLDQSIDSVLEMENP